MSALSTLSTTSPDLSAPLTGLLLTGGGARAAYQVGVLQMLARLRRDAQGAARTAGHPFPVITGTSAGAINAAALACGADDFDLSVRRIAQAWRQLRPEQVYRTDPLALMDVSGRWRMLLGLARLLVRWRRQQPRSLLNNAPLAALLAQLVPLDRLPQLMATGHLRALAVTASSYNSGEHVTFYQSAEAMRPWVRSRRQAVPGPIGHAHLLASAAIPFVFPATPIKRGDRLEYFGDGSMRQSAPISAAIHLGAERILIVGAGRVREPEAFAAPNAQGGEPSLAQIAGHALSSIFLDALAVDVERAERINQTLALIPEQEHRRTALRPLRLLVITPSQRIDAIAARHVDALPGVIRRALGHHVVGDHGAAAQASALASYLLFDAGFTRELMALGRADTLARRDEVLDFFGWGG
ncbi:MAG: patatin-like phospholipase family protein [Zoogloeaceae bacterium]|jgi:NTE family protein|nr:patatin-like phospholipase family protein [Zoogloeaceae bacterium]